MLFPRAMILSAALLYTLVVADTCSYLTTNTDIEVTYPLSLSYINEQNKYWSTSCIALTPSCIIFPKDASEVSAIVKALNNNTENFAVKSGGHNPNSYFSSVEGGPLISFAQIDEAILDPDTGILRAGPGNRLDGIAAKLQGTGWTFVGGRIGNTGIGGLILGGGLSYMSAQYGWSASSVIEYEVVLANGTLTTASNDKNPDLFKALKGGGNNFAIVTAYILQTYRQGLVYGGNLVFLQSAETDAKLLKAVRDFTEYNTDDKAAVIVTAERSTGLAVPGLDIELVDSWILFLFYDGEVVPDGIFNNFTDIGPLLNTCTKRTYADLMADSNWVIVKAEVVQIGTETIPMPSLEYADQMSAIHAHWRNVSSTVLLEPGIVASIAYQPFPKRIAEAARERGGDLIDADAEAHRLILELNYSFIPQTDYDKMADVHSATYGGIRDLVEEWTAEGMMPDIYLPVFMNYGFYREDYWSRLRPESRESAQQVSAAYDPNDFFRNRTGGWKP
ncbi:hypothetical protein F5Y15DRAFT_217317 [Xylariaceae sp. FL0016]|nr:hypothetical protein F5Y15DRAFT_217317 [Xylariaceae sp. FL0016]